MSFTHIPVLYQELVSSMRIFDDKPNIIVDMTLGLGGHACGILEKLHPGDIFVWFDADQENLQQAAENIRTKIQTQGISLHFVHSNFRFVRDKLQNLGIRHITWAYADLGVSSAHFDDGDRGFSFRFDAPLDMRFDRSGGQTARDIVNTFSEAELRRILFEYWEEPKTKFIVEAILQYRKEKKIDTTGELGNIIEKASFDPKSKLRVFQALRMEVNDELGAIKTALHDIIDIVKVGGIISIITFHSLEDRLVKQIFSDSSHDIPDEITGQAKIPRILEKIHKKPITPGLEEITSNPRSRSAKLRIVEKIHHLS